jgi:hypothetical protein
VTAATLGAALQAEGWRHTEDTHRDTWTTSDTTGDTVIARWRDPDFMVQLSNLGNPATDMRLRWEAALFQPTEPMVLAAARAAAAHDDVPDIIHRLPEGWHLCPVQALGVDPLASYAYGTDDGRYLEYRVVEHAGPEQIRAVMYVVRGDGPRLYTEPDCPAGVLAAVALG